MLLSLHYWSPQCPLQHMKPITKQSNCSKCIYISNQDQSHRILDAPPGCKRNAKVAVKRAWLFSSWERHLIHSPRECWYTLRCQYFHGTCNLLEDRLLHCFNTLKDPVEIHSHDSNSKNTAVLKMQKIELPVKPSYVVCLLPLLHACSMLN